MEEKERKYIYRKVLAINGYMGQMHVAIEEMAELTNALVKKERGRATDEDVIGEIADVIICVEQLADIFGVTKVVEMKEAKLRRLAARIETKERQMTRKEQPKTAADGDTEQPSMAATPTDGMEAAAEPPRTEKGDDGSDN